MSRVYAWMTGGVLLSALLASYVASDQELMYTIATNRGLMWALIIAQFGTVMFLSFAINKINALTATMLYLAYAALTGVTLSTLFLVYTQASIATVFLASGCAFGGLSIIGYTTKRDLGPVGAFCSMALFGIIGFFLLSMFFPSLAGGAASTGISILGVLVFAGLTAYDTQKIKAIYDPSMEGSDGESKGAIYGALTLYLDFINLFLMLLRLMGDRRR